MTASMFAPGGGRKPPQVQLPEEDEESFTPGPDARPLLSAAPPHKLADLLRKHRYPLAGSAMAVAAAAGAVVFWLSPYNQVIPVAPGVRSLAASVGLSAPILAPAADLAKVAADPPSVPTREKITIPPKSDQLREMQALAADSPPARSAPGVVTALGGSTAKPEALPAAKVAPAQAADPPPPAPAPPISTEPSVTEVGVAPRQSVPAQQGIGSIPVRTGLPSSASEIPEAVSEPTEVEKAATRQLAALDKAPPAPAFAAPTPNPHPGSPLTQMSGTAADDPAAGAAHLTAGPMTAADDIEVIQLVNQLATLVADEREQISHLRDDEARRAERDADRLSELDRRLSLAEAKGSIAVALGTPVSASEPAASPAARPSAASAPAAPAAGPGHKTAPGSNPQAAPVRQYRVQAASPTLALLAVVDRSGDESDQLQVALGDTLPGGYGKVTRIAQNGTAWVVETEHGKIQ